MTTLYVTIQMKFNLASETAQRNVKEIVERDREYFKYIVDVWSVIEDILTMEVLPNDTRGEYLHETVTEMGSDWYFTDLTVFKVSECM